MWLYVVIMPFLNFEQKNTSCKRKLNLLTLKLSKRHNSLIILRKENKMTENVIPMSESIEDFMSSFGITRLETQKDEGLLSKASCRQRILDAIKFNIQTFKDNAWTKENQMLKLLVDLDEKKNSAIFNVRLGGKRIYRCSCPLMKLDQKIEFLTKFYEAVSKGILDHQIELFCENQVKHREEQKQKQKDKKKAERAKRKADKIAQEEEEKRLQEEAKKHLPNVA